MPLCGFCSYIIYYILMNVFVRANVNTHASTARGFVIDSRGKDNIITREAIISLVYNTDYIMQIQKAIAYSLQPHTVL